ncbi:MAG: hypothetical protein M1832_005472 [Thelocarpon impressellum]|nr:MAG: hypothetical protein M1832_005472 [Thelocarpon impressellum]
MSSLSRSASAGGASASSHLTGLEQTPMDDFTPSSPDTEAFFQSSNRLASPLHRLDQSPVPASVAIHNITAEGAQSGCQARDQLHPLENPRQGLGGDWPGQGPRAASNGTSSGASPSSASAHLSPSGGFLSDAGYSEYSEVATPTFDDIFLGGELGLVPGIEAEYGGGSWTAAATASLGPISSDHGDPSSPGVHAEAVFLSTAINAVSQGPLGEEAVGVASLQRVAASAHPGKHGSVLAARGGPPLARIPLHQLKSSGPIASSGNSSGASSRAEQVDRPRQLSSPVVTVEHYHHDDSPPNDETRRGSSPQIGQGQPSRGHLSPNVAEDEWSDEDDDANSESDVSPTNTARADDGPLAPVAPAHRGGVEPGQRRALNESPMLSLNEQEDQRKAMEKNAEVEHWLGRSATAALPANEPPSRPTTMRRYLSGRRQRAKSMGDARRMESASPMLGSARLPDDDSRIPGPGVLLDEDSDLEDEADEDALSEGASHGSSLFLAADENDGTRVVFKNPNFVTVNREAPAAPPGAPRPWADPSGSTSISTKQTLPMTANAAMARFHHLSDSIETASRVATWGTRRLSETDVDKFLGDVGQPASFSIAAEKNKVKVKSDRKSSFSIEGVKKYLPKRSNSNLKRKGGDKTHRQQSEDSVEKARQESAGSLAIPKAPSTLTKLPRSPKLDTGSAVAAMAGQIAAMGRSGSVSGKSPVASPSGWMNAVRRSRSRSDLPGKPQSEDLGKPGLSGLMVQLGGPPLPTLVTPAQGPDPHGAFTGNTLGGGPGETQQIGNRGFRMDLQSRAGPVIATLAGFKAQVMQLNPRLDPFLVDRISHEQVRRFKRLVEARVRHLKLVVGQNCGSRAFCLELGGESKLLPPKAGRGDGDVPFSGFQVEAAGGSDEESYPFSEGNVAAAQFPLGVPLPPAKRLPAEFECQLCYKVKTFKKPSDWTKHVHEDVQPFTCTFAECAEPKSFKRKADWVRHENERHRHLEWWKCNLPDCSHVCYRKDNFVQHLVREHKRPEPKTRTGRVAGRAQSELGEGEGEDMWAVVDECHHETTKNPKDEACKFCGNPCSSWKKLTVHLARHMEQISLPILDLVSRGDWSADTVISPIEQKMHQAQDPPPLASGYEPLLELPGTSPQLVSGRPSPLSDAGLNYGPHGPGDTLVPGSATGDVLGFAMQTDGYADHGALQAGFGSYTGASGGSYDAAALPTFDDAQQRQYDATNTSLGHPSTIGSSQYAGFHNIADHLARSSTTGSPFADSGATTSQEQQSLYSAAVAPYSYSFETTDDGHVAPISGQQRFQGADSTTYTRSPGGSYPQPPANYPYRRQ